MKYSNSLKYMNAFPAAPTRADISSKRAAELCRMLGRINQGMRCICLPACGAGHVAAMMLEEVIKSAEYKVGRITSAYEFDSRASIFINGEIPSIDDYNDAVEEIKNAVKRNPDEAYTKEEVVFALGLLICQVHGCDFVILEGLSDAHFSLDAICAPFELIVAPTIYDGVKSDKVKGICDTIRRGVREVVSGNQKSEIYNLLSSACAINGTRMFIPVKAQFEVTEISARSITFSYAGRENFTLKNPSYLARDCAMTVIEAALALRRGGVRLPWASISAGLASVSGTGCFDIVSLSPRVIFDVATLPEEAELIVNTSKELWGEDSLCGVTLCIDSDSREAASAFSERASDAIMFIPACFEVLPNGVVAFETVKKTAQEMHKLIKEGKNLVCLGGVGFTYQLKHELLRIMNG